MFGNLAPKEAKKQTTGRVIGLVENTSGKAFQCGTCEYMRENGTCGNPDPKLDGRHVEPDWCCNLYDHDGMRTIVK